MDAVSSQVRARRRPHPAHLPMRRGGRSPLRSSLRPRLRPSLRPTLQLATGPDRRKPRWQRRLPARRSADISTLHQGRDMKCKLAAPTLLSIVPASLLAPLALGAVAIASALATQRLDSATARSRHGRRSRDRTGARTDRHAEKAGRHPAQTPAVGLPEATAEIIASLGEHRVLSTEQVRTIHLPGRSLTHAADPRQHRGCRADPPRRHEDRAPEALVRQRARGRARLRGGRAGDAAEGAPGERRGWPAEGAHPRR